MRRSGQRRTAVVAFGVVCLSAVSVGYLTAPAFAVEPAATTTVRATSLASGTPCTVTAKSCVDLDAQQAWLLQNGEIIRGPVEISSGGDGKETPTGHSLRVYRKEREHVSQETRGPDGQPSPMPWSVFFADGGIAFHGGDPDRASAGCIHLPMDDAQAWYEYLQVGDQVQVVYGQDELATRGSEGDRDSDSDQDTPDPS